jgi:ketosteroid isomerase-like protein
MRYRGIGKLEQEVRMADNGAVISGIYAAFAKGDVPAVLDALDAQVEWREADGFPIPGTFVGPDGVLNGVFMQLGNYWDGFSVTPDEVVASGDRVVSFGHYAGTNKKTSKAFRVPFAHSWRMKDGKVTHFQQYTDTHLIQETMK